MPFTSATAASVPSPPVSAAGAAASLVAAAGAALSFDAAVAPDALDCMADVVPELAPALEASV